MGLFNFGNKTNESTTSASPAVGVERSGAQVDYNPTGGLLNLSKNDILDLSKYDDNLSKVRVAAGWDVSKRGGFAFDLDLCAFLLDKDGIPTSKVYFGDKKKKGIYLDGDNLTGAGDGDDENIYVNLNDIPANISSIVFAVVIYSASSKRQSFEDVQNAFVRLVDENNRGKEICKYKLSENGGSNTAVTFAELYRNGSNWSFKAIGQYSKDSIDSLEKRVRNIVLSAN